MTDKSRAKIINRLKEFFNSDLIDSSTQTPSPLKNRRADTISCSTKDSFQSRTVSEFVIRNHDKAVVDNAEKRKRLRERAKQLGAEYTFTPKLIAKQNADFEPNRTEILYNKGIFNKKIKDSRLQASRQSYKELEMIECTFQPQILKTPPSPDIQPRTRAKSSSSSYASIHRRNYRKNMN